MKKKWIGALLCLSMSVSMLVGCGDDSGKPTSNNNNQESTNKDNSGGGDSKDSAGTEEGKVLNIYCWNEEFKSRITDHYPDYKAVDATSGTIGIFL